MSNILQFRHKIAPIHLDALASFSSMTDREPPLVFAGRERIIEDTENKLRRTIEIGHSLSNTQIVQGPPGSGKTSLLNHLAETYNSTEVAPVLLDGAKLSNATAVASAFVRACGFDFKVLARSFKTTATGRFGIRWLGVGGEKTSQRTDPITMLDRGTPLWDVLENFLEVPASTVFLALIDEAQTIERNIDKRINTLGFEMHNGHTGELKILPIFAGLSSTDIRLGEAGISRPPDGLVHRLGPLTTAETDLAIRGFLGHKLFGFDRMFSEHFKDQIVATLTVASECYPRHLHCYLRSLAKELSQNTGSIDLGRLLDEGHALRVSFCQGRLRMARLAEGFTNALIAEAQITPAGEALNVKSLKAIAVDSHDISRHEFEESLERAIHAGVLEPADEELASGLVRFPVPSLHSFVALRGNRKDVLAEMHAACEQRLALSYKTGS